MSLRNVSYAFVARNTLLLFYLYSRFLPLNITLSSYLCDKEYKHSVVLFRLISIGVMLSLFILCNYFIRSSLRGFSEFLF